ncbi:ABC transporter ATP-binding protein [Neptuniibacter sp. QD34_54]|uniref:ABC transporter ATP-binding protein n=1 Tax=Neptuniibacter sp. QD34_54 TaxID=3398208 RepID=UPI0039F5116C
MKKLIAQLYRLLNSDEKRKIMVIQIMVLITSLSEIIAIGSIAPFMAVIGDMEVLNDGGMISKLYNWSGLSNPEDFVFFLGVCSVLLLLFGSLVSVFNSWLTILYGQKIGAGISNRLYSTYLYKSWVEHSITSSSDLTKKIAQESGRLTNGIILPLLQMNSKIVLVFFVSVALLIYNPVVTFFGLCIFVGAYLVIYALFKSRLHKAGNQLTEVNTSRFKLMSEGFGGIKDITLFGRQKYYIKRFCCENEKVVLAQTTVQTLALIPKYIVELFAYGSVILLVLYLLKEHSGNLGDILPVLAVFGLTGFKVLPALQAVYNSAAKVKGNYAAFESIKADLKDSQKLESDSSGDSIHLQKLIDINNVFFRYPLKSEYALSDVSLKIPANTTVAFVGASGSGKSTIIDLIMGLIEPSSGYIKVDENKLSSKNTVSWQNNIGLVPQTIFLSDSSILENIGFGLPIEEIDIQKASKAAKLACLDDFLKELPEGIYSTVGERGVQLSGGQRQRIGIARALYNNAQMLVFDEATSALDSVTEKSIMQSIDALAGQKTLVLVAHRLSTIKKCDVIYFMEGGKVVDSGTYSQLVSKNKKFKKLDSLS